MSVKRRFAQGQKTHGFDINDAGYSPVSNLVNNLPNCIGQIPVFGLTDAVLQDDGTTYKFTAQMDGIFLARVEGVDSSGTSGADANVAVAVGDILYFDPTPVTAGVYLSKRAGGIRWGYAVGAQGSGDDDEILVQVGY